MINIVAQVTDHVTQFHCSVSPHYTQLGVKIVSLCVSFACKHVFLYQIFPTNKQLSQNYVLVDISTDITWHPWDMSVDRLLGKRKSIPNMFKVPWKNESSALKPFLRKKEDCTSWLFFSRRREFNIWDLLVCWQPQWESQQGVVPLFRERENRERKKKDKYKSEKMILVSKAWDQFKSAESGSESYNKGWYLRRSSSKGKS